MSNAAGTGDNQSNKSKAQIGVNEEEEEIITPIISQSSDTRIGKNRQNERVITR